MALWEPTVRIANLYDLEDIKRATVPLAPVTSNSSPIDSTPTSPDNSNQQPTAVLSLHAESRAKGYDSLCLPLTTDKWRERWMSMCLMPANGDSFTEKAKKRESRRDSRFLKLGPFGNKDMKAEMIAEKWRRGPGFEQSEVTMTRLDEVEGAIAMISDWLELDALDDWVRHDAEIALHQEIAYASYLNLNNVILPTPRNRDHIASYARTVNSCLTTYPYMQISIRLPIYDTAPIFQAASPALNPTSLPSSASLSSLSSFGSSTSSLPTTPRLVVSDSGNMTSEPSDASDESELDSMWEMWDLIRSICGYNTRLSLALDLTPPLPTTIGVLSKWAAESVRYIFLPASTFIANSKGYPVLPKPTQKFLRDSMTHQPTIILAGAASGVHSKGGETAYSQYLRHLEQTSPSVQAVMKSGTVENFAYGYQDYLQAPLQPLMDNLAGTTYQTFEQDPVKYKNYEEAIYRALSDWPGEDIIIIYVVGAGRGPIVARCLSAIERSGRAAFIYAVEKNPNAFVTLQHRKDQEWGAKVNLIFGDMRHVEVPEKADIMISELLGSFGDNELSPECLDGAMRFLKPNGLSIPSSYTAHLAPLSSSKLYNEARSGKDIKSMETPYVVMFQAVNHLSGDGDGGFGGHCGPQIQECWEFEHPRKDPVLDERGLPLTNSHNTRSAKLNFHIPHAGVLHGLAGYFEAVLYGNIGLSIHPHRKDQISKDMLSWFPLFFPFKEPLYLPSNSELHVSIWRLTNQRQVWYEWHAESFLPGSALAPTPKRDVTLPGSPRNSFLATSPSIATPSPLVDANDGFPHEYHASYDAERLVKIGQTSLHNPGGRSSWIGL